MNDLENKWHTTNKEKPEADRIVIGYWISPDDDVMVGLCYLDELGHWYLAQDEPGADAIYKQPTYWIEEPIKR